MNKTKLYTNLKNLTATKIWLYSVIVAVVMTLSLVSVMELLLKGEVTYDYVLTGLVASLFVATGVGGLMSNLLNEQRKSEVALQLKNITALAPVGVVLVRPDDGSVVYTNYSYEEMTGYTADEIVTKLIWPTNFIAEEYSSSILHVIVESGVWHGEVQNRKKDGTVFWTSTYISTIPNNDYGTLWMVYQSNITERKHSEEALKLSESKLSTILENVDSYIYLKDIEGRYLYANRKVRQLFGASMEEIVGHGDEQFFDAEATKQIQNNDYQVLKNGVSVSAEETNLQAVGGKASTYLVVKIPLRNESGEIYALCGISTDISERKQAEDEIVKYNSLLNATLESTNDAILVVDMNNTWVLFNKRFIQMWHIADEILTTKDDAAALTYVLNQLIRPQDFLDKVLELYATPEMSSFDTIEFKDGRVIERYSIPQLVEGKVIGRVWSFRDVSECKQAEVALKSSESRLRAIIENEPECIKVIDENTCLIQMNQAGLSMIEADSFDQVRGQSVMGLVTPEYKQDFADFHQRVLAGESVQMEFEIIGLKGRHKWLETHAVPLHDNGAVVHLAITRDITERKLAENDLRVAAIAFESQEGICVTDANNIILKVNKAFTEITGYSASEVVGKNPKMLSSGMHKKEFYADLWGSITRTGRWDGEVYNRRKNGEVYPQHLTITVVKNTEGVVTNCVATLTDITSTKAAADEIEHLAFYDPLTLLPNRRLLLDRLNHALAASSRSGQQGALLFIDLDHFKTLNDTRGHHTGDLLLQQVATRLSTCVREGDTVARIGGDEFVVVLEGLSVQDNEAASKSEVIANKILTDLAQPYQLATFEQHSSSSIGVTLFNGHQSKVEELLKQADIAMYQSKKVGRNTLRFFNPQMQANISARAELERELRNALEQNQLELHYQVQVDHLGHALGAEALIRWIHPERGMISPFHFIPLAEETGLILPIGQWVLDKACAQINRWKQQAHTRDLTLSINISAKQFRQTQFVEQVQEAISRNAINPMRLKLELTESILLENIEETIATMQVLKGAGIRFSLDDFGTGYSSLQYLKRLPLYQLKIDQSFVRDIATDSNDQEIVRTIIAMAHTLNLNVIAEGVETAIQQELLLNNNCLHYQGYLFGKPLPIEQFEEMLKLRQTH